MEHESTIEELEQRIEQLEKQNSTILEHIDEGYFCVDLKGNFIEFSDAFCRIYGKTNQDLLNTSYTALFSQTSSEKVFKMFNRVYKTGDVAKNSIVDTVVIDGTQRFFEITVTLNEKNEEIIGFSGVVKDMTLEKSYESTVEKLYKHSVGTLARAAEVSDPDTGDHIVRIGNYAKHLAKLFEMDEEYQKNISISAQLHDVGKIHVASAILNKEGFLLDNEFEQIKNHSLYGAIIIGRKPEFKMAYQIALFHHEQWRGEGYPDGLKGRAIPLAARITSIVDVFDALVSKRSYKRPYNYEEAKIIMTEGDQKLNPSNSFDPELLELFISNYNDFINIHQWSLIEEKALRDRTMDVILLEDDESLHDAIICLFEDELPFVNIDGFYTIKALEDFIVANPERSPHLCLIDVNLPDGSGHDIATRLKEVHPKSHLICITADDDIDYTKVPIYDHRVFRKVPYTADFFNNLIRTTKIIKKYDLVSSK